RVLVQRGCEAFGVVERAKKLRGTHDGVACRFEDAFAPQRVSEAEMRLRFAPLLRRRRRYTIKQQKHLIKKKTHYISVAGLIEHGSETSERGRGDLRQRRAREVSSTFEVRAGQRGIAELSARAASDEMGLRG